MVTSIWKRRHEGMHWVIGILLFVVPFVFGIAMLGTQHVWSAWVLGIVVAVAAVYLAHLWWAHHRYQAIEAFTGLVGVLLCLAPWVLNGPWPAAQTWASLVLGLLLIAVLGDMVWKDWTHQTQSVPTTQREAIASKTPYRRRLEQPR